LKKRILAPLAGPVKPEPVKLSQPGQKRRLAVAVRIAELAGHAIIISRKFRLSRIVEAGLPTM